MTSNPVTALVPSLALVEFTCSARAFTRPSSSDAAVTTERAVTIGSSFASRPWAKAVNALPLTGLVEGQSSTDDFPEPKDESPVSS